ncbi:uncharacterized protein LOC133805568 [Humulus lupulus]|uniref:uncharacterized protein LOC133805568 n=1 Tax=Humulus lupulus TaxID=3486 RepID=UPI002B404EA8|nr:uncharacterized protein LOC133805568 [Humulus lupulus]
MAKKKKSTRKPVTRSVAQGSPSILDENDQEGSAAGDAIFEGEVPTKGLTLIAKVVKSTEFRENQVAEHWASGMATLSLNHPSWADKVEKGDYQAPAHNQWQQFMAGKLSFCDKKLEFAEPLIKDGKKITQVDIEEVKCQSANWSSAIICMVLGANPPMAVFEGFIKRVWGHLGIVQIARMTMGLTMVKFNDDATRDCVLENGILQFDRKLVIICPWTTDLSAVRLIRSVPLWIRLHDLGLQYWGSKCLSALVSTIGKSIMVEKFTRERSRVQFARVFVEMDIPDNPPRIIQYLNEYGQLVEQAVDYEWLPMKCKVCSGYGHAMVDCRMEMKIQWVQKDTQPKIDLEGGGGGGGGGGDKGNQHMVDIPDLSKGSANATTIAEGQNISEATWKNPKKVVLLSKQGPTETVSTLAAKVPTGPGQNRKNSFKVLQEQAEGEKGDICGRNKVGVGALLETKMRGNKVVELMAHKFTNLDFYSSPVTEGKILIIWRKIFVKVIIIEETNYGERKRLWQSLPRLTLPAKSWVIWGDFNAIFTVKDRSGGKPVSKSKLMDSSQWLAGNQVDSLKSTGSFFTWTNNQDGPARIYSKIDHVFTNDDWLDFFPTSTAVFHWETVSDHCSCIVSATSMENMGVKLFRFYNFWIDHQDFKEVNLNSWRKPINETGLKAIYLKTMTLKHRLKRFNRDNIGDIGVKYQEAKGHYQEAQIQAQKHP